MNESFLQYIWKFGLFNKNQAVTTDGELLEFLNLGTFNTNAGPDFFNAKIKIGNIIWVGNVEIHINASDWKRHKHTDNKDYDNVILHVVQNADCQILRADSSVVPIFILKYNPDYEKRYNNLLASQSWVACQNYVKNIDSFRVKYFLNRLLVERLEQRSAHVDEILKQTKNDFKEAFYRLLFRAFGFGTNALPFELLAQATPLAAINKHRNSVFQLEALLFGQAGFLSEPPADNYQEKLQKEYLFLQNKFNLQPLEKHIWKFLRLRPTNFPTVRIAQIASFLAQSNGFIAAITSFEKPSELNKYFNFCASEYWDTHYIFGKETTRRKKTFGKTSTDKILINVVVPYLFAFGKAKDNQTLCDKSLDLLEIIAPEHNSIIDGWAAIGVRAENAFYAQALIQLKTEYCNNKRCLQCHIGNEIVKNSE